MRQGLPGRLPAPPGALSDVLQAGQPGSSLGIAAVDYYDSDGDSVVLADGRVIPMSQYLAEVENYAKTGYLFQERLAPHPVIEAMCEPDFNYHGSLASTGSSAQLIVVNGPIAKELNINSGVNIFGPGWRANSTIGRAVRLIIMNVTGGTPGILDKSTLGQGGKYSMCIAENEDVSPW